MLFRGEKDHKHSRKFSPCSDPNRQRFAREISLGWGRIEVEMNGGRNVGLFGVGQESDPELKVFDSAKEERLWAMS